MRKLGVVTVTLTLSLAICTGSYLATRAAASGSTGTSATKSTPSATSSARLPIIARGIFFDLVGEGSDLLALRMPSPQDTTGHLFVVRIDPTDGRTLASSPGLYNVQGPVVVASHVWVIATDGPRLSRFELLQLDPRSLRPVTRISLSWPVPSLVGGAGLLWLEGGCELERVNPANGAVLISVRLSSADCVEEIAGYNLSISVGGNYLVAVPQPGVPEVLDAHSGRMLSRQPNMALGAFVSLVAADGYLWVLDSSASLKEPLYIYKLPGLRLVKTVAPWSLSCTTPEVFSGCPGWIEYLNGMIWGGGGLLACASPKTLAMVTTVKDLGDLSDLVTVGNHTYGIQPPDPNNPNNATDVVRFTPPAACSYIPRS